MVEPLIHFTIPLVALSLSGVKPRKALLASFVAMLPDIDALFLIHRWLSHSLIVVLALIAPVFVLARRSDIRACVILALAGLLSHLTLDLFTGYTPLFWPLYNESIWVLTSVMAHISSSPRLRLNARLATTPTEFKRLGGLDAPLFTGSGLIVSAILISPIGVRLICREIQRRKTSAESRT